MKQRKFVVGGIKYICEGVSTCLKGRGGGGVGGGGVVDEESVCVCMCRYVYSLAQYVCIYAKRLAAESGNIRVNVKG